MAYKQELPDLSGYDDPEPFPERPSWLEYGRLILVLFVFAYFLLNWIIKYDFTTQVINIIAVISLFGLLTLPHEGLHKLIAEKYEYDAEVHVLTPYPHNVIREQKILVEDYLQILLAPIKYMTIPILVLIILVQFLNPVIPTWIDVTGILSTLLFTHFSSCADDLHQWRYLRANYSLDDVVYMVDDVKDSLSKTFPFFKTGYYKNK